EVRELIDWQDRRFMFGGVIVVDEAALREADYDHEGVRDGGQRVYQALSVIHAAGQEHLRNLQQATLGCLLDVHQIAVVQGARVHRSHPRMLLVCWVMTFKFESRKPAPWLAS